MVDTFYSGGFSYSGLMVEWDGSNHDDIVDWVNEVANSTCYIVSVTASELRLTSGMGIRVYQLGGWVGRGPDLGPETPPKEGRWKTSDPFGRPEDIADIEAP